MKQSLGKAEKKQIVKRIEVFIIAAAILLSVCACGISGAGPSNEWGSGILDSVPETAYSKKGELTFVPRQWISEGDWYEQPYAAFDADGNQILPYEYSWNVTYVMPDRYIVNNVVKNTGTILIDGKGNEILPSGYTLTAYDFSDEQGESAHKNWIAAKRNSDGKCGFIDPADGSVFIEPKYLDAAPFVDGYAPVRDANNMWGIINEDEEYVIPPEYYMETHYLDDELAIAAYDANEENVYICREGDEIWVMRPEVPVRSPSEFPELPFENGLAVVMEDKGEDWNDPSGKYGVIDKHGKIVVPLEYEDEEYPQRYISSSGSAGS